MTGVPRPRLLELLERRAPLVVVSGPAGAGKSVLLDQWCARASRSGVTTTCRIRVEHESLFWRSVLGGLAQRGLPVPASVTGPGRRALLGDRLVDEVARTLRAGSEHWTVVVDGLELTSRALAEEIERLLAGSGEALSLVLAARVDPVLCLYRRRLDGTMTEVRAADLAFSDEEAASLLASCGVPLPPATVHALNERMGGWAAGLRFAGASMARHPEPANVVAALVTADLDLTQYVLHEVLDAQEPETRQLLLRTCVPDVLDLDLAEELVGRDGVRGLSRLACSNLFLEPAAEDGCLRYHPVFRDLLRVQLGAEDPQLAAGLHRQVATWLRRREHWAQASEQLATGGLWEEVAEQLVEDLLVARILAGSDDRLGSLARRLPDRVTTRAGWIIRAALSLASDDSVACAQHLARARRAAPEDLPRGATWTLSYALVEAVHASSTGRIEESEAIVRRASRTLAVARHPAARLVSPEVKGLLELSRARVALRRGDLGSARASLEQALALPALPTELGAVVLGHRALAEALAGELSRAVDSASEAISLFDDACVAAHHRHPAAHVALARVALERHDLTSVPRHLGEARTCRGFVDDPVSRAVASGVLAHVDPGSAGPRGSQHDDRPELRPGVRDPWLVDWMWLQAAEADLARGLSGPAATALERLGSEHLLPASDVVAAAICAEQGRTVAARRTLDHATETDPSPVTRVSRLLVEAVDRSARQSPQAASQLVREALDTAALERIRRPFCAAPPSVRRVLHAHQSLVDRHPWLQQDVPPEPAGADRVSTYAAAEAPGAVTAMVAGMRLEPLTPKELEVLNLLADMLDTQEIADQMVVSVNTVRTHIRNILRKLDVHRRNEAVRRARQLGLPGFGPAARAS
jgi:LuxR family maltose regulon positive regulatory protein